MLTLARAPRSVLRAPCSALRAPRSVLRAPCSALRAPRSALEGPLGLSTNAPSLSIETGGDYDAKLSSRSCSALEGSPSSSANAPSLPTETGGDCDAELSSPLPSSPPSIRRVAAALPLGSVLFDLLCHNESPKPPCQAPQNINMASESIQIALRTHQPVMPGFSGLSSGLSVVRPCAKEQMPVKRR